MWTFFDMVPESENNDGKPRAKCKMCGITYMAASKYGTGNMKRHIDACPRRSSRDIGQMMLSQGSGSISVSIPKFETEQYRELLIAAIVKHELPFRFVEYSGVRSLLQYLRPDVPIIYRNTAKADLVKIYSQEKRRIKCMLNDSPGRISLTSNLWTSITTDGYMCITAHFLDKNWVLQKRVLNFSFMPPPHNGISLSEKIYNLLCEWGIQHKIYVLTLDNASSNDVSVELLRTQLNIKKALLCDGEFFHLRCCAHILNLIVQHGLKEIDFAIQKVRESIKYVKGSQSRKVKFLDSTKQMSLDSKKGLRQDVPTRWNSTYLMLESAIFYRRAFSHLELTDSNFKHCPSIFDWEKIEKINSLLGVFYEATCDFSGTKYPTANLYFPAIFLIYFTLKRHSEGEDDYMKTMCCKMLVKFEKYWSEFNVLLAIAVILDPRYKLHFVDFSYTKLYGDCSIEYMNVRSKMSSLFMEYSSSSAPTCSTTTSDSTYSRAESQSSINKQAFQVITV
ncbi:zinc finger BED domain-containing protein RICESLEEPER 1-like [Carya illinoinensis]|uniref:zinc finger BED domain-containing protein RICESLEEPER 1-like n=1 Tax=Carya illinoinensis TaxID=32201 RepID=UPI001C729275|nr:zinc finger BED domain-containing protein RICESLEEPER 1-like [Carya illinoinensis]